MWVCFKGGIFNVIWFKKPKVIRVVQKGHCFAAMVVTLAASVEMQV